MRNGQRIGNHPVHLAVIMVEPQRVQGAAPENIKDPKQVMSAICSNSGSGETETLRVYHRVPFNIASQEDLQLEKENTLDGLCNGTYPKEVAGGFNHPTTMDTEDVRRLVLVF